MSLTPPPSPPSPRMSLLGLMSGIANNPSKWTKNYQERIEDRLHNRFSKLEDRMEDVVKGRVVPDIEDLTIGSGRQLQLAILFLDICGFSAIPNWSSDEQKAVLSRLYLFMSEMVTVVRDFEGHFEKNTGD